MERLVKDSDLQPIVACCTPFGRGALALLRVSGQGAIELVSSIAGRLSGRHTKLVDVPGGRWVHGYLLNVPLDLVNQDLLNTDSDKLDIIDEVVFIIMRAPASFTGQDTVEITCHNNPLIINKIIASLIIRGARAAQGGEFALRAVMNGKLDLSQAEAINEIITANNLQALQCSLAQLKGSLSSHLAVLERNCLELAMILEAGLEFQEEEHLDLDFKDQVITRWKALLNQVDDLARSVAGKQRLQQGIKVVIAGPPNAGKSTLFNNLLGYQRAIVSPLAGTTRDTIEAPLLGEHWQITLTDTAGMRETQDELERQGVERSHQETQQADVTIVMFDGSQPLGVQELETLKKLIQNHETSLFVANKNDLGFCAGNLQQLGLSCEQIMRLNLQDPQDVKALDKALQIKVQQVLKLQATPFFLNNRQANLVQQMQQEVVRLGQAIEKGLGAELLIIHVKDLLQQLIHLTGKDIDTKVMNEIFSNFCIGK